MIKSNFSAGGFVVHKVYCNGKKFSVWYDAKGNLEGIEKFDNRGRSIPVSESDKLYFELRHEFYARMPEGVTPNGLK